MMKTKGIFKNKPKRSVILAAVSAGAILLVLVLNFALTYIGMQRNVYIDLSAEGLYTLTDKMKEDCDTLASSLTSGEKIKITFCQDPDTLMEQDNTRPTYLMAMQLDNRYDVIECETVNVTYNPTAVAQYKATTMSQIPPTSVIISYGDRYRVVGADNFWSASGDKIFAYNGEYKMLSFLLSVTAVERPVAYFVTGHGEDYYDAQNKDHEGNIETEAFYNLLSDRGLEVKTLKLSEITEIPEDCVLLIVNDPKTDYTESGADLSDFGYVSETEKIEKYLVTRQGALMVAKDYAISLPVLEAFLFEWGFEFSSSLVSDTKNNASSDPLHIVGSYDADENSYGQAIYGELASLPSAPKPVITNTGYITSSYGNTMIAHEPGTYATNRYYAPFIYSGLSASANSYDELTGGYTDLEKSGEVLHLAAVTTRIFVDEDTEKRRYSYILAANSPDFFSGEYLSNASWANYDILSALTENMTRIDEYASNELGGSSPNYLLGGKNLIETTIYSKTPSDNPGFAHKLIDSTQIFWCVAATALAPIAALVLGVVICVRRKFL